MTIGLTLVPGDLPPESPPLSPLALELAARLELQRALGLSVSVRAPSWRAVMFMGKPISFHIPPVPEGVTFRVKNLDKDAFRKDPVGVEAIRLAETLQKSMPTGYAPRSVTAARPMPASHADQAKWARSVFLVGSGPDALPLLVAAGYLTPMDCAALTAAYPNETKAQQEAAIGGARAYTEAGQRTGINPELPGWLNDQLITLMDESRPTGAFQDLYAKHQAESQQGPAASQGKSRIAQQFRPEPGPDRTDQ